MARQLNGGFLVLESILYGLYVNREGTQNALLESVELIEASPRSTFHQTDENPVHRLHVDSLKGRVWYTHKEHGMRDFRFSNSNVHGNPTARSGFPSSCGCGAQNDTGNVTNLITVENKNLSSQNRT